MTHKIDDSIDFLTLKKILGRNPSKQQVGLFECKCGAKVERTIGNTFGRKDRVNPASCGCKAAVFGRPRKDPERKAIHIDFDMANRFIMGKI